MDDERMRILKRVETGELSAQEAVRLINELGPAPSAEADLQAIGPEAKAESSKLPLEVPKHLAQFWLYPLYAGVGVVILGAIILYAVYGARAGWGWALCGWPVFAAGVLVVVTAWWLRTARWVHVRVRGRENVTISIPIPIKLTAWAVKIAKPFVPQFRETGVDEIIEGMGEALGKDGQPIFVDVNDKDQHVQVYIG